MKGTDSREIKAALGLNEEAKRKSKKRTVFFAAALVLIIGITAVMMISDLPLADGLEGTLGEVRPVDNSGFSVHFIDVGQGDCTLIICDNRYVLVDSGEQAYGQTVCTYLRSLGIRHLDCIIATHPHSDHIGALPTVIESFGTELIIQSPAVPGVGDEDYYYTSLKEKIEEVGCKTEDAVCGASYSFGDMNIDIIGPVTADAENLNDCSVAFSVTYGDVVMLMPGDAEAEEEAEMLNAGLIPDCDILKVAHHGSAGSTCSEFLEAAKPEYCIIEVGAQNSYGHPSDKTVDRLYEYTDNIYRTDYCGNIVLKSDGKKTEVECNRPERQGFIYGK